MNNKKAESFCKQSFVTLKARIVLFIHGGWNAPINFETIDNKLLKFNKVGIETFYILPYPKNFRPQLLIPDTEYDYLGKDFLQL